MKMCEIVHGHPLSESMILTWFAYELAKLFARTIVINTTILKVGPPNRIYDSASLMLSIVNINLHALHAYLLDGSV